MDYIKVIEALRAEMKRVAPEDPHPKSGVYNDVRMRKRLDCMVAHLKALGCDPTKLDETAEAVMMFNAKRLRAAWRADDDNVKTYIDAYIEYHNIPKGELPKGGPGEGPREGEGNGEGEGDPDEGKDPEGKDPNGGEGASGSGVKREVKVPGFGDGEGEGDGSKGEGGSGSGGEEQKEGEGQGEDGSEGEEQKEGEGQGEQTPKHQIPPSDPNYCPPEIWDTCCRIILHNLKHPDHRLHIVLVGPKGIGKTALVMQLSKTFFDKVPYALTAPQQEWKIVGYCDAMGKEVVVPFKEGYVNSGIILIDELDRAQPEALISINMALANGVMDTPASGLVYHHDGSTVIATANTAGTGATTDYNTANQLDASTRDRFIFLLMKWEHGIAMKVADGDESLVNGLEDWNQACDQCGFIGNTASYRAISQIHELLDMKVFDFDEAIKATVLKYALSKTDLGQVYSGMKTKNGKVAKAIKRIMDAMPDNEVGY